MSQTSLTPRQDLQRQKHLRALTHHPSTHQGGSGQTYDWSSLRISADSSTRGWLLAGGLHPGNVAEAVAATRPTGVDVSSGVCGPDGLAKDHGKVQAFVAAALSAVPS